MKKQVVIAISILCGLHLACEPVKDEKKTFTISVPGNDTAYKGYPDHSVVPEESYYAELEINRKIMETEYANIGPSPRKIFYLFHESDYFSVTSLNPKWGAGNIDLLTKTLIKKGFTIENNMEQSDSTRFEIPGEGMVYYHVLHHKLIQVSKTDSFMAGSISKVTSMLKPLADLNRCSFYGWKTSSMLQQ